MVIDGHYKVSAFIIFFSLILFFYFIHLTISMKSIYHRILICVSFSDLPSHDI